MVTRPRLRQPALVRSDADPLHQRQLGDQRAAERGLQPVAADQRFAGLVVESEQQQLFRDQHADEPTLGRCAEMEPVITLAYPIEERTLDNGLRVIASPDHGAPSVAVNLWYDVGSRDEEPGRTGFAHLFEHIMFQGSANVASGQHIGLLQAAGASVNATTWFDRTNYFETLPTGGLDLALWLEADRLGTLLDALTQESLDNQREVVKEERRQRYDNVPYGDAIELLIALDLPGRPSLRAHHHRLDGRPERGHAGRRADLLPHPLPAQQRGLLHRRRRRARGRVRARSRPTSGTCRPGRSRPSRPRNR